MSWTIYTDGSVIDGRGGWAFALYLCGSLVKQANGRCCGDVLLAETIAAENGIAAVPDGSAAAIYCDHADLAETLRTRLPTGWDVRYLGRAKNTHDGHGLAHRLARRAAK